VVYERFIAKRNLSSARRGYLNVLTWIAILAVTVSVGMYVALVSVAGGFVDAFRDRVLGVNAHLVVMKNGVYFGDYAAVADELEALPGVASTAPFIIREMLVTSTTSSARPGALIKGITADSAMQNSDFRDMVVEGSLEGLVYRTGIHTDSNPDGVPAGVAVGAVLAERLKCEVGDTLTLISPLRGVRSIGAGGEGGANFARVTVSAIIDSGFYDYDARLLVMDVHALQELLGLGDTVMGVEVRLHELDDTDEVKAQVTELMQGRRVRTLDWRDINRNLFTSLNVQRIAMTAIVWLMVLVAATVIHCVLFMTVLERRREIAVLRSLGATSWGIKRIFILQGMTIGVLGTAAGLVLGVGVCYLIGAINFELAFEVYRVQSLPVSLRPTEMLGAVAVALSQCFLATLIPARKAAKVSPADALRYD
jgi:lipoprotein-releasing system permease protein